MTTKLLKPIAGSLHNNIALYDGYVAITADGYVGASTLLGVTVTNSATGEYTFTLDDPKGSVVFAAVTFVAATAVDKVAQVKSFSTSAVVARVLAGATATQPNAVCGLLVSIHYKRSTARAGG